MKCVVCKEEINEGATFCSKCSHYQNNFRNNLLYLASIAAIITVIASGFVYIIKGLPELKKLFFPNKKIQILALNTSYQLNILNSSDGPVFIRDYTIKTPTMPLTKLVNLFIDSGGMKSSANKKDHITKNFVNNIPPEDWGKYIDVPNECYGVQYMIEDSTPLKMIRANNNAHTPEYETTATINYFYIDSGEWLECTVDVSGLLYMKPDFCKNE